MKAATFSHEIKYMYMNTSSNVLETLMQTAKIHRDRHFFNHRALYHHAGDNSEFQNGWHLYLSL